MKTDSIATEVEKTHVKVIIKKSLLAGIGGYFLFLFILLVTKSISVVVQSSGKLQFELADFILPVIGFILLSLIKFLENFRDSETI